MNTSFYDFLIFRKILIIRNSLQFDACPVPVLDKRGRGVSPGSHPGAGLAVRTPKKAEKGTPQEKAVLVGS